MTHDNRSTSGCSAHVVLYQPEIPQNTGNVGRTCVATGAKLWIVRPAGFQIDDTRIRRAGLDYWQHLKIGDAKNWDDLKQQLPPTRIFFFSKFAKRTIWDARFQTGDTFVFGRESSGLPRFDPRSRRRPGPATADLAARPKSESGDRRRCRPVRAPKAAPTRRPRCWRRSRWRRRLAKFRGTLTPRSDR